jgi:hypothetical protein
MERGLRSFQIDASSYPCYEEADAYRPDKITLEASQAGRRLTHREGALGCAVSILHTRFKQ